MSIASVYVIVGAVIALGFGGFVIYLVREHYRLMGRMEADQESWMEKEKLLKEREERHAKPRPAINDAIDSL